MDRTICAACNNKKITIKDCLISKKNWKKKKLGHHAEWLHLPVSFLTQELIRNINRVLGVHKDEIYNMRNHLRKSPRLRRKENIKNKNKINPE